MLLRLLYEEKLAQASYFVGCQATGEALVTASKTVEPIRLVVTSKAGVVK